MNMEKLNALIEGVRTFKGFNMAAHNTCLCAVAGVARSKELADYLEWPEGLEYTDDNYSPVQALVLYTKGTRVQAIATLEHLRDTGKVVWED